MFMCISAYPECYILLMNQNVHLKFVQKYLLCRGCLLIFHLKITKTCHLTSIVRISAYDCVYAHIKAVYCGTKCTYSQSIYQLTNNLMVAVPNWHTQD